MPTKSQSTAIIFMTLRSKISYQKLLLHYRRQSCSRIKECINLHSIVSKFISESLTTIQDQSKKIICMKLHHNAQKIQLQTFKHLQKHSEDVIVAIVSASNYIVNVSLRGTTAQLDDVIVTPAKIHTNSKVNDIKRWHRLQKEHLMPSERKLEVNKSLP